MSSNKERKTSSLDQLATPLVENGISKNQARLLTDAILARIEQRLLSGEAVSLPGLCKISVVSAKPRKGRNPNTGEIEVFPARRKLKFSPSGVIRRII